MSVPSERRRYPRFEIELSGRIGEIDGAKVRCVVRDYCQGGFLVERQNFDGPQFVPGQQIRLETSLVTARGEHPFKVGATISWVHGNHLGLSFANPSGAIVEVMAQHRGQGASPEQETPDPATTGSEARALARMRYTAKGMLPNILRELLRLVAESVLEALDRVVSDTEQHQVLADMSSLDALRRDNRLLSMVLDRAGEPGLATPTPDQPDAGELDLVDQVEFERWLEASRVATILDREFTDQLGSLGSRLAALRGDESPSMPIPFEPQHFTLALKGLATELEFCATTREVLFDCARDVLLARLGGLYRELDAALDKAGAPAVGQAHKLAFFRKTLHAMPNGGQDVDDPLATSTESPIEVHEPREEKSPAQSVDGAQPGLPKPGASNDLVSIDRRRLQALLDREERNREAQAREMMQHVVETPNLGERFENWMEILGEPMVREAQSDKTFFRNPDHPLREIMDTLGHLHMFRPDRDVGDDDPLDRRISQLLKAIAAGEVGEEAMRLTAEEINGITAEKSQRFQHNSERVAEAAEGRDRVRRAQLDVIQELNRRYVGHQVPLLLPDLLESGWIAVLKLALLNRPEHEHGYHENLALLDELVGALGGEPFEPKPDIPPAIVVLMSRFGEELSRVAFDPYRRNEIEREVRHHLARQAQSPAELMTMTPLHPWPDQADEEMVPDGITPKVWQRLIARCDAVAVGDVLRFLKSGESALDLHVAWIRDDRHLFVLVDHRGLRDREISRQDLALGLHGRTIEQVTADGRPLSERAVDSLLSRMEEQLVHQAAHDSLTGLINRQQFQAVIEREICDRDDREVTGSLLWIDLDQFRLINDIHGYDTGDRLLIAVARVLERTGAEHLLGHQGADRFSVLLAETSLADAERLAGDICTAIAGMTCDVEGQAISLTASIGVIELAVGNGNVSNLLRAADNALSAAKMSGGNCYYAYCEDDPDIVRRRESVQWVAQVDEALEHGRLHLRCQPIVPVRHGEGLSPHYEVLLGVAGSSGEALPILEFIEAAENYNRMRAVDRWVTRTVMESIAGYRDRMPELHGFAVNLSGQTASDPGFVEFVREQFQRTGIDPAWLSFEVTETAAVTDLSSSANIVHDLKAMGCKVALDDFGSGLASYAYLKELPVDWLKIDGAFVRKISADREDYEVVKSINDIGHFLGKETIAEYVCDQDILRLVGEIGVDYAQGYHISPPLLLEDLLKEREESA